MRKDLADSFIHAVNEALVTREFENLPCAFCDEGLVGWDQNPAHNNGLAVTAHHFSCFACGGNWGARVVWEAGPAKFTLLAIWEEE